MLSGDEQSSSLSDSDELLLEGVVERDEIVIGESCWPLIDGLADCGELVVNGALKKVLFKSSVPLLNADLRIL
jgi:hypothetical protein